MPQNPSTYDIDDAKSVDHNLSTYEEALGGVDAPLAAVLAPHLSKMSLDQRVDYPALLDALFNATGAKKQGDSGPSGGGTNDQTGGAS